MVENGPRNSAGAFGLGSKVSNWEGPPHNQMNMTDFALPCTGPAIALACNRSAQCRPSTDDAPTCKTLLRECFPTCIEPRLKISGTPACHSINHYSRRRFSCKPQWPSKRFFQPHPARFPQSHFFARAIIAQSHQCTTLRSPSRPVWVFHPP